VRYLPGILLAVAVALTAHGLHGLLPAELAAGLGAVLFAVLLGMLVGNLFPWPERFRPGIRFSFGTLLRLAIVLLGARLSFDQLLAIGGKAVGMILLLMVTALSLAHLLGRLLGLGPKLATLVGVGTAVCGNTAIVAAAPTIGAEDDEVSLAVATNTLFGTTAIFFFPLLGRALGMDDATFGTWAGTAVNDTSQVVAAGFAFSPAAGEVATAVKLTRNALMGFVLVAVGLLHGSGGQWVPWQVRLRQSFPVFVLGFLAMALLRTAGLLDGLGGLLGLDVIGLASTAAKGLILVALAAVGLGTSFATIRRTGWSPFLLGFSVSASTALLSFLLILWWGPAGG
jgi:uncharacterized integral membrane protein (TIGR00698 family)